VREKAGEKRAGRRQSKENLFKRAAKGEGGARQRNGAARGRAARKQAARCEIAAAQAWRQAAAHAGVTIGNGS